MTKALIETEIAAMFLGEDPFDLERILSKATFVPLYYGKCGHCAIAGLELACWDLMGKAIGQPLCQLLGGRLREEIPFAAYLYHRLPDGSGKGEIDTTDQVVAHARGMIERHGFGTIKYKGGVKTPEEEIETLRALRAAFPAVKLRYDPQAIYSPATSIRIGKKIEALDLEYYEDPCWGHDGMARVRQRVAIPMATNMCVIDLDGVAVGVRLGSVDVILGDIFEWGGISRDEEAAGRLRGLPAQSQFPQRRRDGHRHRRLSASGGLGPGAAPCPRYPYPGARRRCGEAGRDPADGARHHAGARRAPASASSSTPTNSPPPSRRIRRQGDKSVYAEDAGRAGVIPVKSMY